MNIETFVEYCLAKPGTSEHFPFDADTLVIKVGGKMFALSSLSAWEKGAPSVNLKCDPEIAEILRAEHDDVLPGYHMSKKHWNTVSVNRGLSDKFIYALIDDSYNLVLKSLTKKLQNEIAGIEIR